MRKWVACAFVMALLAGCADGGGDDADTLPDGTEVSFQDAKTSAEAGAITGVVVDATVRPVAGVTVALLDLERSAVTDDAGLFAFDEVLPGLYSLTANGTGYLPVQTTAEVTAGKAAKVKIVIPLDTSPKPFHETLYYRWFDSVGQPLVDFAWDLFRPDDAPPMCDECEWTFQAAAAVETLIIEAEWEDNIEPPHKDSEFYWTIEPTADSSDYESDYFYSPGLARIDGNRWGENLEFFLMLAAEEEWVVVDQEADVYVSLFYVGEAPDGWSFIAGDR